MYLQSIYNKCVVVSVSSIWPIQYLSFILVLLGLPTEARVFSENVTGGDVDGMSAIAEGSGLEHKHSENYTPSTRTWQPQPRLV